MKFCIMHFPLRIFIFMILSKTSNSLIYKLFRIPFTFTIEWLCNHNVFRTYDYLIVSKPVLINQTRSAQSYFEINKIILKIFLVLFITSIYFVYKWGQCTVTKFIFPWMLSYRHAQQFCLSLLSQRDFLWEINFLFNVQIKKLLSVDYFFWNEVKRPI